MTRRQRAFWMVTVPVAAMLAMNDRILGAQEPTAQPMASRSGIELGVARQDRRSLHRLLPVRLRRLDREQPGAGRPAALRPVRGAAGAQQRDPARHPREAASRRAAPNRERSATTTPAAWTRAAIDAKGAAPLAAGCSTRIAAIKSQADIPAVVGQLHTLGVDRVLPLRRRSPTSRTRRSTSRSSARAVSACPIATTT